MLKLQYENLIKTLESLRGSIKTLSQKNTQLKKQVKDLSERIDKLETRSHSMGSCGYSRGCD